MEPYVKIFGEVISAGERASDIEVTEVQLVSGDIEDVASEEFTCRREDVHPNDLATFDAFEDGDIVEAFRVRQGALETAGII